MILGLVTVKPKYNFIKSMRHSDQNDGEWNESVFFIKHLSNELLHSFGYFEQFQNFI